MERIGQEDVVELETIANKIINGEQYVFLNAADRLLRAAFTIRQDAERIKVLEAEMDKLQKDLEATYDEADTLACECDHLLKLDLDDTSEQAKYNLKYAMGCLGVAVQKFWDSQSPKKEE